jgi:hypothetical protein
MQAENHGVMKTEKVTVVRQKARFLVALMAMSMIAYIAARLIVDLNS